MMRKIQERISSLLSYSTTWLASSGTNCLACTKPRTGKETRGENENVLRLFDLKLLEQSLCSACLISIPWIQRIYCPICGRGVKCEDCTRSKSRSYSFNRSAVDYDEQMKGWLAHYKYRGDERLGPILGAMLVPAYERLTEAALYNEQRMASSLSAVVRKEQAKRKSCWAAVTYVPISNERAQDRGFNQAEQMASFIAAKYELDLYHLLNRDLHTEKQSFKTRMERLQATRGIFTLNHDEMNRMLTKGGSADSPRRILLVDDIYTTGSTVGACASTLKLHMKEGIEVYVLTWARS